MAPYLKLENLQLDICTLELNDMMALVWSVSFPIKSQPVKFIEQFGKTMIDVNF